MRAIDAIKIRIEKGKETATVPAIPVMGELYLERLPKESTKFSALVSELQEYSKKLFQEKQKEHPALAQPTGAAFNTCNGVWTENIYAIFAWNTLAKINKDAEDKFFIYVKLPSNRNEGTSWLSLLDEKSKAVFEGFPIKKEESPNKKAFESTDHKEYSLSSSNPDAVILKVGEALIKEVAGEDESGLDPRKRIENLSVGTISGL